MKKVKDFNVVMSSIMKKVTEKFIKKEKYSNAPTLMKILQRKGEVECQEN